jgi:hypothetical protein
LAAGAIAGRRCQVPDDPAQAGVERACLPIIGLLIGLSGRQADVRELAALRGG